MLVQLILLRDYQGVFVTAFLLMVQAHGFCLGMDLGLCQLRLLILSLAKAGIPSVRSISCLKSPWCVSRAGFSILQSLMKMTKNLSTNGLVQICNGENFMLLQTVLKFGYRYVPGGQLRVECETCLGEVFRNFNLKEMVINMGFQISDKTLTGK